MALPVTLRCECGETHETELGQTVRCRCGRVYEVDAPLDAQARIMRAHRGLKTGRRAGLLIVPACGLGAMAITGSVWGMLAAVVALVLWYGVVLRLLEKRYLRAMGAVSWHADAR